LPEKESEAKQKMRKKRRNDEEEEEVNKEEEDEEKAADLPMCMSSVPPHASRGHVRLRREGAEVEEGGGERRGGRKKMRRREEGIAKARKVGGAWVDLSSLF
jgi:hypothetical protein